MPRYIDADKLMLHLNDYKLQVSPSWKDDWEKMVSCLVIDTCMDAVQEQPTADVRENVKGEWIYTPIENGMIIAMCPICKKLSAITPSVKEWYRFCPNCGAEMRQVVGKLKNSENSTLSTR